MSQLPIVSVGESAGVILPAEVLQSLGLRVGDVLQATLGDHELILRASDDNPSEPIEEITRDVLEKRRDAYRRLA